MRTRLRSEGFRLPWVFLSTMTTGARLQQPRQETVSTVNSRSAVVSPAPTFSWSLRALLSAFAFATWQAVPWQTLTTWRPTGWSRNCA